MEVSKILLIENDRKWSCIVIIMLGGSQIAVTGKAVFRELLQSETNGCLKIKIYCQTDAISQIATTEKLS